MSTANILLFSTSACVEFDTASLIGNTNFSEYSVAIMDPLIAFENIGITFPENEYQRLMENLAKLNQWIKEDNTLICIIQPAWQVKRQHSTSASLYNLPPFNFVSLVMQSGTRIEYCGRGIWRDVFTPWLGSLRYEAFTHDKNIEPLLRVQKASGGPQQFVGGIADRGDGRFIFLPIAVTENYTTYLKDLSTLHERIRGSTASLPSWVQTYRTSGEKKSIDTISGIRKTINSLESDIEMRKQSLLKLRF